MRRYGPLPRSTAALMQVAFGAVGAFLLYFSCVEARSAIATRNWPTVRGVVLSSVVRESWGSRRRSYKPSLTYEYHVGGKAYVGSDVSVGNRGGMDNGFKWANAIVDSLHAGVAVDVYYDPSNADNAVLLTGVSSTTVFGLIMGSLVLGVALFLPKLVPVIKGT